jgi:hypothetical protein
MKIALGAFGAVLTLTVSAMAAVPSCPPGLSLTSFPSCEVSAVTLYVSSPAAFCVQAVESKTVYAIDLGQSTGVADNSSSVALSLENALILASGSPVALISNGQTSANCGPPGQAKVLGTIN